MTMIEMTTTLRPLRSPLPLPEPLSNAPYLGAQFLQVSLSSLSSSIAATVSPSDLSLPKYAAQVMWQADDLAIAHLRVVSFSIRFVEQNSATSLVPPRIVFLPCGSMTTGRSYCAVAKPRIGVPSVHQQNINFVSSNPYKRAKNKHH